VKRDPLPDGYNQGVGSLQRIRGLIAGEPIDHLPAQPLIMQLAARHAGLDYNDYVTNGRRLAEAQISLADAYGIDCLMQCSDPARELIDIAGGDDSSVEWAPTGPAIVESRALVFDKAALSPLRVPDPLAPGRMRDRVDSIEIMREAAGPDTSIVGWVEGPLALAAEMRGLSALMLDTYEDAGFLDELLDFTSQVGRTYWKPQVEAGADTIGMSDAAASMMSPGHYERFIFPAQKRVVEDIKSARPDVIVRLHMCGRTDDLLPIMKRLPVDIFELDFPVDLVHAREVLGPEAVILGNVNTVEEMLTGSPEDVYAAAADCHRICGSNHVVGTGCEVAPETPPENLRALVAYARDHAPQDVPRA
jgi:MtaA/CmuA family methyltransferase